MIKTPINYLAEKNMEFMSIWELEACILSYTFLASYLTAIIVYFCLKTSFKAKFHSLETFPLLSLVIMYMCSFSIRIYLSHGDGNECLSGVPWKAQFGSWPQTSPCFGWNSAFYHLFHWMTAVVAREIMWKEGKTLKWKIGKWKSSSCLTKSTFQSC